MQYNNNIFNKPFPLLTLVKKFESKLEWEVSKKYKALELCFLVDEQQFFSLQEIPNSYQLMKEYLQM